MRGTDRISVNALLAMLDPDYIKVDERSVSDRLSFAANYAKLIYFYDKHNRKNGDWSPFFLKDPAILAASIASTNYSQSYALFSRAVQKFKISLDTLPSPKNDEEEFRKTAIDTFNFIFQLIQSLFVAINGWVENMEKDYQKYELKSFVFQQVRDVYRDLLWSVLSLQQSLSLHPCYKGIEPPEYSVFDAFQEIWKVDKKDLGFDSILRKSQSLKVCPEEIFESLSQKIFAILKKSYRQLFGFYTQVIHNAEEAFRKLVQGKNNYPDTALLTSFVKLMEVQQGQLNKMTSRHLDFYYQNVLKQKAKKTTPDEVFLFIRPAQNIPFFKVNKGLRFNAGMDAENKPVIFESEDELVLNPTKIQEVYTLHAKKACRNTDKTKTVSLYKRQIDKPTEMQKDEQGAVSAWNTFGDSSDSKAEQGFAVASPMLYLEGGERRIVFTFTFESEVSLNFFDKDELYLSTEKGWFKAPPAVDNETPKENETTPEENTTCKIGVKLSPSDPPIVPFKEETDSISSPWPIFKVVLNDELNDELDLATPPKLTSMKIKVTVGFPPESRDLGKAYAKNCRSDISDASSDNKDTPKKEDLGLNVDLYNDHGKLPSNSPFMPLGPIPDKGDHFYIGSREVFAKPISSVILQLGWNNLPDDFEEYYQEYNDYLNGQGSAASRTKCLFTKSACFFARNTTEPDSTDCGKEAAFCNSCFQISFHVLQKSEWIRYPKFPESPTEFQLYQEKFYTDSDRPKSVKNGNGGTLMPKSTFFMMTEKDSESLITPDPDLLLSNKLDVPGKSEGGFLRITLQEPKYGFGHNLYAKIVAKTAQDNALIISKKKCLPKEITVKKIL